VGHKAGSKPPHWLPLLLIFNYDASATAVVKLFKDAAHTAQVNCLVGYFLKTLFQQ
jgi:hypothetical protein